VDRVVPDKKLLDALGRFVVLFDAVVRAFTRRREL